jgi:hypothetical protein
MSEILIILLETFFFDEEYEQSSIYLRELLNIQQRLRYISLRLL